MGMFIFIFISILSQRAHATEFYSESQFQPSRGLVSDLRLRHILTNNEGLQTYLGLSAQHQDLANQTINSFSPHLGAKLLLFRNFAAFAEYRHRVLAHADHAGTSAPDPYLGLMGSDFTHLYRNGFFEYYGDLVAVPRRSSSAVLTWRMRLGWRNHLNQFFLIDPYAETFLSQTPDPNLGKSTQDLRGGVRVVYQNHSWSSSAAVYQSMANRELQGTLTIGGLF